MNLKGEIDGIKWSGFSRQRAGRRPEFVLKYRVRSGVWKSLTAPVAISTEPTFRAWVKARLQKRSVRALLDEAPSAHEPVSARFVTTTSARASVLLKWVAWCEVLSPKFAPASAALSVAAESCGTSRWVYFIQQEETGPIKVGITSDLETRVRALQNGSAHPLRCAVAVCGDARLERELHKALKLAHLRGEWFKPCAALFKLIELAMLAAQPGEGMI